MQQYPTNSPQFPNQETPYSTPPTPPQPDSTLPPPSTYSPTPQTSNDRSGWKSAISTILILIIAPLIALLLTAYVFQSYEVDGQSMERTLQNNDRLIILKVPRTWARITKHSYIPPRGDIVVFIKRGLSEFGESGDKQLIKRVIGLPGERVIVRDGKITIYNKEHPNGFDPDANAPWGENISTTSGNVDLVVPEGELFVCGDNRANSLDSRIFGTIPANDVVGKLSLRMLPISKVEAF